MTREEMLRLRKAAKEYAKQNCEVIYGSLMGGDDVVNAFKGGAEWRDKLERPEVTALVEAVEDHVSVENIVFDGPQPGNSDLAVASQRLHKALAEYRSAVKESK